MHIFGTVRDTVGHFCGRTGQRAIDHRGRFRHIIRIRGIIIGLSRGRRRRRRLRRVSAPHVPHRIGLFFGSSSHRGVPSRIRYTRGTLPSVGGGGGFRGAGGERRWRDQALDVRRGRDVIIVILRLGAAAFVVRRRGWGLGIGPIHGRRFRIGHIAGGCIGTIQLIITVVREHHSGCSCTRSSLVETVRLPRHIAGGCIGTIWVSTFVETAALKERIILVLVLILLPILDRTTR